MSDDKQYIGGVLGQWMTVTTTSEVHKNQPIRWIFEGEGHGYEGDTPQFYSKGLRPVFDGTCHVEAWFPHPSSPTVKVKVKKVIPCKAESLLKALLNDACIHENSTYGKYLVFETHTVDSKLTDKQNREIIAFKEAMDKKGRKK